MIKTSAITGKHEKGYSVFHTTDLSKNEIFSIAEAEVIPSFRKQNRELLAWFNVEVKLYEHAELKVVEEIPPPRHHNVFGMPMASAMEEAEKLAKRQEFIANAEIIILE